MGDERRWPSRRARGIHRAALVTTVLLCLCRVTFANEPLRIVADPWAPFGGTDLPRGGLSLDVIATVLRRAGHEVHTEIVPWARALEGIERGDYDIVGSLFRDETLEASLAYSAPFFETEVRFAKRAGAPLEVASLADLVPYTIAVGEGYFYEPAFDAAENLDKHSVTTVSQGIRMVAAGRVDLTLDSVDVLDHILRHEHPELADRVEYLPWVLARRTLHFGMRDDHPQKATIIADFARTLERMRADGSLDALLLAHRAQAW